MCGIFGIIRSTVDQNDTQILGKMSASLNHRGPDGSGVFRSEGISIGNVRLSIIDHEGGRQPFVSEDGQVAVVQNGEIYNYIELSKELSGTPYACITKSDTEVILRLYLKYGINFVNKLNGMFAIAIYDRRFGCVHLIRDRIGVKPLYVFAVDTFVAFASEIKCLIESGLCTAELNSEALHHYLSFNYVPPPFTMFKGVEHLPPGCLLTIKGKTRRLERWWSLANIEPIYGRSESDWIDEFRALILDAVRLRLRCDVAFGAFLSGGVDSSTIVALMSQCLNEPVKTFCIGFNDKKYDESIFAETAASRFRSYHKSKIVDLDMLELWPKVTYYCDQPHGDVSFLPTYVVSQMASEDVKVVLTGDGADELFAGYDKYKRFFEKTCVDKMTDDEFVQQYFSSVSIFSEKQKSKLYESGILGSIDCDDSCSIAKRCFLEVKHQDRINQVLYMDMVMLLSGNNLVKPDRMGMAVSLEARTPFLDYRMMEFAFKMPGDLKLKNGITKWLYKKAVAEMIGTDLAYRSKQMFTVPIGEWFKLEKSKYCVENLPYKLLNEKCMLDMHREHVVAGVDRTRELRALIAVNHWLKRFIS